MHWILIVFFFCLLCSDLKSPGDPKYMEAFGKLYLYFSLHFALESMYMLKLRATATSFMKGMALTGRFL